MWFNRMVQVPTTAPPTGPLTSPPSTSPPTSPPTDTPTLFSLDRSSVIALIQSRLPSTTFDNPESAQSQALEWVLNDELSKSGISADQIVQRFALATLYFSTDGTFWSGSTKWLEPVDECTWAESSNQSGEHIIQCDSNGDVDVIKMQFVGLFGT